MLSEKLGVMSWSRGLPNIGLEMKKITILFAENKGGAKTVWNFSKNLSVLVAPPVPYSNHANVGQILGHGPPSGNKQ